MDKLFCLLFFPLLFVCDVFAEPKKDVPAPYLKGGDIVVSLKDGTLYFFSADEWKVVKRGVDKPASDPILLQVEVPVEVEKVVEKVVEVPVEVEVFKKHRLGIYGGWDASRIEGSSERRDDPVVALGYEYMLNPEWNAAGLVTSHNTLLLGGGFNF